MIKSVVSEDCIIFFWEKTCAGKACFNSYLNGRPYRKVYSTHAEFKNLAPDTEYRIKIEDVTDEKSSVLFDGVIFTAKAKTRLDVTKPPYNAVPDGKTFATDAIQRAINDCSANDCVYFPDGEYLTGALDLKSNVEIRLSDNAKIQGSEKVSDYLPKIKSRFEGFERECYRSLFNLGQADHTAGYVYENVIIRGGTIFGGGEKLMQDTFDTERELVAELKKQNEEKGVTYESPDSLAGKARGRLINIYNTQNVLIADCKLGYAASWNVHLVYSKDIVVCGCELFSEGVINGDGIDPDSSENCYIFGCKFEMGDDSVAVKSGKNLEGYKIGIPCHNVRIFDCSGRKGIALGSEMSAGVYDVKIWDCYFVNSRGGLRLRATQKRGGYIKDVCVYDSAFTDFHIFTAFGIEDEGESAPKLTEIDNIYLENMYFSGRSRKSSDTDFAPIEPIRVRGFEGKDNYIKNVTLKNVTVPKAMKDIHAFEFENVINLTIQNLQFTENEEDCFKWKR